MKKIILFVLLVCTSIQLTAQEKEKFKYPQDNAKKHELKLNAFSLIAFSSLNVSYENLLNKDSSLVSMYFTILTISLMTYIFRRNFL